MKIDTIPPAPTRAEINAAIKIAQAEVDRVNLKEKIADFLAWEHCPYKTGAHVGIVAKVLTAWEKWKKLGN